MTTKVHLQFPMQSNYPHYQADSIALMSTPQRVGALSEYTGRGVQIAFIDSGFSNHADLAGRIRLHVDASTENIVEEPRVITYTGMSWHGQMTSVIASGDGSLSQGQFRGIASEADLILIKVSTLNFQIKERDILRGLKWIYDSRERHNIRVVNVSVGGDRVSSDPSHHIHDIVKKLTQVGITVVVAAGNSGSDRLLPPASAPDALVIGGYDDHNSMDQDQWTLYTHNHGNVYNGTTKPDLIAPANWIVSPLLPKSETEAEIRYLGQLLAAQNEAEMLMIIKDGKDALNLTDEETGQVSETLYYKLQDRIYHHKVVDSNHQYVDGTSVAAPIVASVIAQMLQIKPDLTPMQIRHILMDTAKLVDRYAPTLQGAGLIQAGAAVKAVLNM
jgi:serine protease AprX